MNKFDLKDRIDSIIYGSYNILSDILFVFNFKAKKLLENNKSYKVVEGKNRCFILGTGPSLRSIPNEFLDFLSTEATIGVNFLYKSDIFNKVKPKYYALVDDLFWGDLSNVFSDVYEAYGEQKPIFITDYRAEKLVQKEGVFIYAKNYPTKGVRLDLSRNSSALMNVVSYSIASAIFLGFKEIYLLGCDYNAFCSGGAGHCYDDGDLKNDNINLAYFLKFYHLTTEFHYLLSKEAKRLGVKVINITEGSLLDAYPRKSFADIKW